MNEDERERERLGLRDAMRKTSEVWSECHRLLDVVGVPRPDMQDGGFSDTLVKRVQWLVAEYKMPGYHAFEEKLSHQGIR